MRTECLSKKLLILFVGLYVATLSNLVAEERLVRFEYQPYDLFWAHYEITIPKKIQLQYHTHKRVRIEVSLQEKILKKWSTKPLIYAKFRFLEGAIPVLEGVKTRKGSQRFLHKTKKQHSEQAFHDTLLGKAIADYHSSCVQYNKLAASLGKEYKGQNDKGKYRNDKTDQRAPLITAKPITAKRSAHHFRSIHCTQLTEFSVSRTYAVSVSASSTQPALTGYVIIELLTYPRHLPLPLFATPLSVLPSTQSSKLDCTPRFEIEVFFVPELHQRFGKIPLLVTPHSNGISIWNHTGDFPQVLIPELKKLLLREIKNYQDWNPKFMDRLYHGHNWRNESLHYIE